MKLFFKNLVFTLLVPGTVGVYLPLWLARGPVPGDAWSRGAGIGLLVLGGLLYGWCVLNFALVGGGTPAPIDAPKRLVVRGPHRFVRNPMYLGVLAVVLGWAVLYRSPTLGVYAVVVFVCFHAAVRFVEEPALERQFGAEYARYRGAVRRWRPRISGWRDGGEGAESAGDAVERTPRDATEQRR